VTLLIASVTLMGLSLFTAGLELIGTGTSIQRMLDYYDLEMAPLGTEQTGD